MESPGDTGQRTGVRAGASLAAIVAVGLIALLGSGCGGDAGSSTSGSDGTTNSSAGESTSASADSSNAAADNSASAAAGNSAGSSTETTTPKSLSFYHPPKPKFVTVDSLRETAAEQKEPLYWAGERPGTKIAVKPLTKESLGRASVRYLTGGAKPDDPRAIFFTISTYIHANPAAMLGYLAKSTGDKVGRTPNGTPIYYDHSQPESIHLAFPKVDAQVEVFYPGHFEEALRLVNTGQVAPVP